MISHVAPHGRRSPSTNVMSLRDEGVRAFANQLSRWLTSPPEALFLVLRFSVHSYLFLYNLKLLETTVMLEKLMAAAAAMGCSSRSIMGSPEKPWYTPAATGMRAML